MVRSPDESSSESPSASGRRYECLVLDWAVVERLDEDLGEFRVWIEELCDHGMELALVTNGSAEALDRLVQARPRGPGRLLLSGSGSVLQAGADGLRALHRTDAANSDGVAAEAMRWLVADLWARGIAPDAVFTVGPYGFGEGSPTSLREFLTDQLRLRAGVPVTRPAPEWSVVVDGSDRRLARVHESLLTLADGRLGTRGTPVIGNSATTPAVFMAGVYAGLGPESHLAPLPLWSTLDWAGPAEQIRQTLDLHAGIVLDEGPVTSVRFSSFARPGTVLMRASGPPELIRDAGRRTVTGPVSAALLDTRSGDVLNRVGCYDSDPEMAEARLVQAQAIGFERLLRDHREEWARRWAHADVVIEGDPVMQRGIRFALFHLMASVGEHGEVALGARGLSGPAYLGHVFWDTDVFVLPFLAATHPAAARAMLEYRIRRLPVAYAVARGRGLRGARFPWESAVEGVDVTPDLMRLASGEELHIRTGELEEHVVADVAWAVACYLDWTGDAAFAAGPGGAILAGTARYWASRVRIDADGRGHIDQVMGPDEYHQPVDDNAFTNVMARWNLRRAAALADVPTDEAAQWLAIADAIVDGYDTGTGLYEQFAGFFALEPLIIADTAPRRPIAAELLLGVDRTARAQVVKQADVLMLHHLVPDETAPGSLQANLAYYEPRTAHGSSLSPPIHASLLARAGRPADALAWLRIAARMDLDDLSGSTAGGLHMATMGGLWQALVFGFAGLHVRADRLYLRPQLPPTWPAMELNLRFRGTPLRLRLEPGTARVDSGAADIRRVDEHWEVVPR